jgi:hypothetical protein
MHPWRAIFALAAFVNFVVGGAMAAAPRSAAEAIGGGADPASVQFAGWLIFTFGVGYAMVARAPAANRGIVWIGAIGKFGAVAIALWRLATQGGYVPAQAIALPLIDLAFVALFALFLWRGPRPA